MDYSEFTQAEYVAENFKEACGEVLIEIVKRKNDIFDLGFHDKDSKESLFENPQITVISGMTLDELIQLKEAINRLIERIVNQ